MPLTVKEKPRPKGDFPKVTQQAPQRCREAAPGSGSSAGPGQGAASGCTRAGSWFPLPSLFPPSPRQGSGWLASPGDTRARASNWLAGWVRPECSLGGINPRPLWEGRPGGQPHTQNSPHGVRISPVQLPVSHRGRGHCGPLSPPLPTIWGSWALFPEVTLQVALRPPQRQRGPEDQGRGWLGRCKESLGSRAFATAPSPAQPTCGLQRPLGEPCVLPCTPPACSVSVRHRPGPRSGSLWTQAPAPAHSACG